MNTFANNPGGKIEPAEVAGSDKTEPQPDDFADRLKHFIRRPMLEAVMLYAFFWFSAHVAIGRSHGGELYDLTPRGPGLAAAMLAIVVGLTVFHLFYTLPSLINRKWLGAVLK